MERLQTETTQHKSECSIVLIALYRYQNFPTRIMHPLLKNIDGINVHSIFFKNCFTNVFKPPTKREKELFLRFIRNLNPKLVGFSVLSPYVSVARELTRLIKDNTSALVIWGGVHPTISPESCIDGVDMLCVGEGEKAICELAACLRDNRSYQSIKNLWVKDGNRIIKNPLRPLLQDLDSLPFPSYGDNSYYFIDSNRTTKYDPLVLDDTLVIYASRGCPYSCSYCANGLLKKLFENLGTYVRRRSVNNVIREIKENDGKSYIHFVDEIFGSEQSWLNEFELKYKREINLPFFVAYHPKGIPPILDKLVNAGLDTIYFGIQTGSEYILRQIFQRPGNNEEILSLIKKITEYGIKIRCDLILDNPYETEQTLKNTIELLLRLPKSLSFNLHSLQYFPKFPLTQRAIKDGYIEPAQADADSLKTATQWAFVPKLPHANKQILQNIVWLMANNQVKNKTVEFAVFSNSRVAKMCLHYLSFKSVILGEIIGVGGFIWRNLWIGYFIKGIKYISKGNFRTLYFKIKKIIKRLLNKG